MVMAVVSRDQSERVLDELISSGLQGSTFTESRGGMLQQTEDDLRCRGGSRSMTLSISSVQRTARGVEVSDGADPSVPRQVPVETRATKRMGYAVVFVWDLDRFQVTVMVSVRLGVRSAE